MRKSARTGLVAAAVLASGLALTATPASADDATWTISPAGNFQGFSDGPTTLKDEVTGTTLTCTDSTADGNVPVAGSNLPGEGIANVTGISFTNCSGPGGLQFTVIPSNFNWPLNAGSYDGSDVTTGTITGIKAKLQGPGCSADVGGPTAGSAGQVVGTYTNSTNALATSGGNLTIHNVVGCFGLIGSGHASTFKGTYFLDQPVEITSP
ncbi:hypothetical protein [Spirillospora sp. CA-294931]|uniref:hypothetical protein n=1 Tax=Spirillospora sp. CA-294931 TaxID=3240042 RepID=UPI003D94E922